MGRQRTGHRSDDEESTAGTLLSSTSIVRADPAARRNLIVEGSIDAQVPLHAHGVAIARTGRVRGDIHAAMIRVEGRVEGDLHAQVQVRVCYLASVRGDITAPVVIVEEGAEFEGRVLMEEPRAFSEARLAAGETV